MGTKWGGYVVVESLSNIRTIIISQPLHPGKHAHLSVLTSILADTVRSPYDPASLQLPGIELLLNGHLQGGMQPGKSDRLCHDGSGL